MDVNGVSEFIGALFPASCSALAGGGGKVGVVNITEGRVSVAWADPGGEGDTWGNGGAGALALSERGETYVTCCLRDGAAAARHGGRAYGGITETTVMPGLWLDIDVMSPFRASGLALPPTVDDAYELLDAVGVAASVVVHSGYGLQPWFLFKEPVPLVDHTSGSPAMRGRMAILEEAITRRAQRLATLKGWHVDSKHSLASILRLPGTHNRKGAMTASGVKPVTVDMQTTARYTVAELEAEFSHEIGLIESVKGTGFRDASASGGSRAEGNIEPMPMDTAKFQAMWANSDNFKATWELRRPDLGDKSFSGHEMSLACQAIAAGWADGEVVTLMSEMRRAHRKSQHRRGYADLTIAAAHRFMDGVARNKDKPLARELDWSPEERAMLSHSASELGATPALLVDEVTGKGRQAKPIRTEVLIDEDGIAVGSDGEPVCVTAGKVEPVKAATKDKARAAKRRAKFDAARNEGKAAVCELLMDELGVGISGYIQRGRSPATFYAVIGDKEVQIGSAESALSFRRWKTAVYEATLHVLTDMRAQEWDEVLRLMNSIIEFVEVQEGDRDTETREWIAEHVEESGGLPDKAVELDAQAFRNAFRMCLPFKDAQHSQMFLNATCLLKTVRRQTGVLTINPSDVRKRLAEIGFAPLRLSGRSRGAMFQRSYWVGKLEGVYEGQGGGSGDEALWLDGDGGEGGKEAVVGGSNAIRREEVRNRNAKKSAPLAITLDLETTAMRERGDVTSEGDTIEVGEDDFGFALPSKHRDSFNLALPDPLREREPGEDDDPLWI